MPTKWFLFLTNELETERGQVAHVMGGGNVITRLHWELFVWLLGSHSMQVIEQLGMSRRGWTNLWRQSPQLYWKYMCFAPSSLFFHPLLKQVFVQRESFPPPPPKLKNVLSPLAKSLVCMSSWKPDAWAVVTFPCLWAFCRYPPLSPTALDKESPKFTKENDLLPLLSQDVQLMEVNGKGWE